MNGLEDILQYYQDRSVEFLPWGWSWDGSYSTYHTRGKLSAVWVDLMSPEQIPHRSVFVLEKGRGLFKRFYTQPYVTSDSCTAVVGHLVKHGLPFVLPEPDPEVTLALMITKSAYTDETTLQPKRAKRSGLSYMNHIYEGLYILRHLYPSNAGVQRAWCLHPVYQDVTIRSRLESENPPAWASLLTRIPPEDIAMAEEYAEVANAHLSHHPPKIPALSKMDGVNRMLVADKVQNCKELEYSLPRASVNFNRLKVYFQDEWMLALGVSTDQYRLWAADIARKTGITKMECHE